MTRRVARLTGLTIDACDIAFRGLCEVMSDALISGESVYLRGIGTLSTVVKPEQTFRAINGETMIVPEHKRLKFSTSKTIKQRLCEEG